MPREKAQAAPTARPKVLMRRRGADCPVVVLKRGNARGAKGAGHRRWERANWQQEELQFSTEGGSPSCGGTSRMTRECQVRICEGLGVKFPGPTRRGRRCSTTHICFSSTSVSGSSGRWADGSLACRYCCKSSPRPGRVHVSDPGDLDV